MEGAGGKALLTPSVSSPQFNNERVYAPVESRSQGNVAVGNVGIYIIVETDFGLVVKYDGNHFLEISLPGTYFSKVSTHFLWHRKHSPWLRAEKRFRLQHSRRDYCPMHPLQVTGHGPGWPVPALKKAASPKEPEVIIRWP